MPRRVRKRELLKLAGQLGLGLGLGTMALLPGCSAAPSRPAVESRSPGLTASPTTRAPVAWAYEPPGWLDGWKSSLQSGKPAWVTLIGDSFGQGAYAADWRRSGWFGRVRAALLDGRPAYADFLPMADSSFFSPTYAGQPAWTIDQPRQAEAVVAGIARVVAWRGAAGGTPLARFTSPDPCTRLELLYQNPFAAAGESWRYQVDDDQPRVVVLPARGPETLRLGIDGLDSRRHRVTVTEQSVDSAAYIYGISTFGEGTLGFASCAVAGEEAAFYNDAAATQPPLRWRLFTPSTFPSGAQLTIIALGINDLTAGRTAQQFGADLEQLIQGARQAQRNGSILLVVNHNPAPRDGFKGFGNAQDWPGYVDVMRLLASRYTSGLVDFQSRWTDPYAAGFITAAQPHPNDQGHADMAAAILALLQA